MKARLDRAFANSGFLDRFEHTRVRHIVAAESDHCFVLVELRERLSEQRNRGAKQFRYENVWQTHTDYERLVTENWERGAGLRGLNGVVDALKSLQGKLSKWGAEEFGCLARTVRKLRQKLTRLRANSMGRGPSDEEKAVVKKLRQSLHQEEIWMKQRSRVVWLREGDRNTSFFHACAAQRKRMNTIESLERADGSSCLNDDDVHAEVQNFYQSLYTSQGFSNMDELLVLVQPMVTEQMNEVMDTPYSVEEVKMALFQMGPSKAPGIDGFTAGFFQRHWSLLGHDVTHAVLDFLNGGVLPVGMNDTSITLIPKVRHPRKISQYRPISLCSVLYKIGAKCIANRLRVFLGDIIGEEQSAFVPGRQITDNVLIAYESVHAMRRRKKGKNHSCAIKLDMMKAYDRVEWHYLEAIMVRLGFSDVTVRLIMKCVNSVRFTVRVNGELLEFFTPSRGLRQGDPISPYLFLLCSQGFTALLNNLGGALVDTGIRVSTRSPWINHLLFADDSLIFMKACAGSGDRLNEVLRIYGQCSGQSVNREKSSVFFSPNTPEHLRQTVKLITGISVEAFTERYLGLPTAYYQWIL